MKKTFVLISFFILFINCFGQQLPEKNSSDYYSQKARKQNSLGWTLLGSGTGVFLISLAIFPEDYSIIGFNSPEVEKQANAASAVAIVGFASMVTSVPFFIASGVNRRKSRAATIGLKFENRPVIQQYSLTKKQFPVLSLKIAL